jgi:hypothetical protein
MNIWLLDVWTNGTDCAIASNKESAMKYTAEYYHSSIFGLVAESVLDYVANADNWSVHPFNSDLTINSDIVPETKTALEWIIEFGDGYLGRIEKNT